MSGVSIGEDNRKEKSTGRGPVESEAVAPTLSIAAEDPACTHDRHAGSHLVPAHLSSSLNNMLHFFNIVISNILFHIKPLTIFYLLFNCI